MLWHEYYNRPVIALQRGLTIGPTLAGVAHSRSRVRQTLTARIMTTAPASSIGTECALYELSYWADSLARHVTELNLGDRQQLWDVIRKLQRINSIFDASVGSEK